jgi:succinate-semialdehyde dehydrogenase/glutarate-semialdehyde dehydrogenase
MIVCADADVDAAAKNADVGRFFNCGQMCLGVKRLFVHEAVYDAFVGQLRTILEKKTVGNGTERATRMGPLHLAYQREEIEAQVEDARARGATVLVGGGRPDGDGLASGNFYLPTLLENAPADARVVTEEVFGPVLPVFRFTDLDQAIEMANASMYGLGGSIWTRDLVSANRAIDKLQVGNVWVNSLHYGYDELPFGGVKASGLGREHGPEALDYYLEPKGVVIAGLASRPAPLSPGRIMHVLVPRATWRPWSSVTSHSVSPTLRPPWTTRPVAVNRPCQTGRRKLILSSSVANVSPSLRLAA